MVGVGLSVIPGLTHEGGNEIRRRGRVDGVVEEREITNTLKISELLA